MPVAAASAGQLSLVPELLVEFLRGLGPADLRSARLACSGLRSLVDTQVVTGLKLDVALSERPPYWRIDEPEDEQADDNGVVFRHSLEDLEDEEAGIAAGLGLGLPQLALQLLAIHDTLLQEQKGIAELQQLAHLQGQLVEMLEQQMRLHEVRRQQVEVRLEQAAQVKEHIEQQLKCAATAEEAVVQLTAAKARCAGSNWGQQSTTFWMGQHYQRLWLLPHLGCWSSLPFPAAA